MESMLQDRSVDWKSDLEVTVGIQTIYPTWSVSYKKWHGPQFHQEATAVVNAPVKEESVGAMSDTIEDFPVVTAVPL